MLDSKLIEVVKKEALENNLQPALLLAVVDVESNGTPFWKIKGKNKPVIRFEGHYFYARLKGDVLSNAIKLGLANKKPGGVKNPIQGEARYNLLARAQEIDSKAALESTSWGLGQVMGANWESLGYSSVDDLVKAASTLEGQVDMMMRYIKVNNLITKLLNKDWKSFTISYNGKNGVKNGYHTKLKAAYDKYLNGKEDDKSDILTLQKRLNVVGSYGIDEDGILGPETIASLKDFQLKNGLVDDGKYGPLSRKKLEEVYLQKMKEDEGKISGGLSGIGAGGAVLSEAGKMLEPLAPYSQTIQYVFVGLLLLGVGFSLWTLFRKKA
jgi:hypothetical protein